MVRGKTLDLRTSCEFRNLFSNCLNFSHESEKNHVFGLNAGKTLTNKKNKEMIFVCKYIIAGTQFILMNKIFMN